MPSVGTLLANGRGYLATDPYIIFFPALFISLLEVSFNLFCLLYTSIYAALKKNKWQDHFISTAVMIFVSVPSYVYAFLVQYFLCFKLRVFPFQMEAGYDYFSWKTFVSMVPAVLSLGFGTVSYTHLPEAFVCIR